MRTKVYKHYVCDFETTVYDGQEFTEVWASAVVQMYTEDVKIFHSIGETLDFFYEQECNIIGYYHNLKFDGAFWLSYLLDVLNYKLAISRTGSNEYDVEWKKDKDMENNSFKCSISDKGQWYTITIKHNDHIISFRDSLKLLPFSVKRIGKAFKTKHQKLDMEYKGFRYAGCEITPQEQEYIANDVLVVKEALEFMFSEGHDSLTIGSCCLKEYKEIAKHSLTLPMDYKEMYPDLTKRIIEKDTFKYENADAYIRKSYRGGWCYLAKGKENRIYYNGTTADVNSLYPSMMHSQSGNRYPVGQPQFWTGNEIPKLALMPDNYYFIRIKTRFYIKDGKLPFIQIKGNTLYKPTEMLESSDVYDYKSKMYYTHYRNENGELVDTRVELTMTKTDFELFKEHYNVVDFEILDGCWFYTAIGIFDEYIDKYKKIKMTSKGAVRELAKLFLNNLYGKMSSSTDSSYKIPYLKDDESVGFIQIEENNKQAGYIPVGSAITSYARNFTIRAAQKNYHGVDKPGFIYADTDSIHCDLSPEEITGIRVDNNDFCCWKLESCWDNAIFTRQKTYIEHITHENQEPIDEPFYDVKCAGMPDACKNLFVKSLEGNAVYSKDYTPQQRRFLFDAVTKEPIKRTLADFKMGLKVYGKLMPKRIKGGILLVETTYEMR